MASNPPMTSREQELSQQVELLRRENALLRQKIDLLARRVFGSSSEQLDLAQMQLLLQGQESVAPVVDAPPVTAPKAKPAKSSASENKPRLPENVPVVEEVIDPDAVKAQPEAWRCIGQEVTEQLDDEPGRFLRRRTIRRKYVHRQDQDRPPVIAPLLACLQERGLAAPGLLAHVLVGKYCDHLPLYRQE